MLVEVNMVDVRKRLELLCQLGIVPPSTGGMPLSRFHLSLRPSQGAFVRLVLIAAICATVAGCGRRGGLEYPVDPNDPRVRDSGMRVHSSGREGQKVIRGYVTPDSKFVLDPLL